MRPALGLQTDLHKDDRNREQDADRHDGCDRHQRQALTPEDQFAERKPDIADIGIARVQAVDRRIRQMMSIRNPVNQRAAEDDDDADRK